MNQNVKYGIALVACLAGLAASNRPAQAIPDVAAPSLIGVSAGAELGVAGKGVSSGLPYDAYVSTGVAHLISARVEVLGGGSRTTLTNLSGSFSLTPLPLVNLVAEPGITNAASTFGPSLGLRATESLPLSKLRITGYGRVHYLHSRATTEFGIGADYPVAPLIRASISAIDFNGGFEPNGFLFLIGLKARLGV